MLVEFALPESDVFDYVRATRLTPEGDGAFATSSSSEFTPVFGVDDFLSFDFSADFEVVRLQFFQDVAEPRYAGSPEVYHARDGSSVSVISEPERSFEEFLTLQVIENRDDETNEQPEFFRTDSGVDSSIAEPHWVDDSLWAL